MDTNSRMQIADKAMKSFIARYFRDDEDGTGMITGEFYWPRAEIMEVVMDAWDKTKDPYYQELMGKMYRGFVKEFGEDWSNNPFNDDIMWMTIACARAYQAFHEEIYLQQAEKHFNLVFDRAWSDDLGGGLFWRIENTTKNACINGPAVIAASLLYQITKNQSYLDRAIAIYDWEVKKLFGDDGAVYDCYNLEKGLNAWCSTYNQGTFIGASVFLHQLTGEEKYVKNAVLAADYTMEYLYKNGIMNNEADGDDMGLQRGGSTAVCVSAVSKITVFRKKREELMKRVHLICNAHLDPVWLWRWQEGCTEALSTFRTAEPMQCYFLTL